MLGHRYGWSHANDPDGTLLEKTFDVASVEYPWLQDERATGHRNRSITEIEIQHRFLREVETSDKFGVLCYIRKFSPDKWVDKGEPAQKLAALKERLKEVGVPVKEYETVQELADMVRQDLTALIDERFPPYAAYSQLEEENDAHELFGFRISSVYVGAPRFHAMIDQHLGLLGGPLIIAGDTGTGKSALIASYFQTEHFNDDEMLFVLHYVGVTQGSCTPANAIFRFMNVCKDELDIEKNIPAENKPDDLVNAFPEWINICSMKAAVRARKLVLVIDGVQNFNDEGGVADLSWLPSTFPNNFYIIITATPKAEQFAALRQREWHIDYMEPLAVEERQEFVEEYLVRQYSKKLDGEQMARLVNARNMGQPMRLITVCEELRRFGQFFKLNEKIQQLLDAASMTDLYVMILDRLEVAFPDNKEELLRILSFVFLSRQGMSQDELMDLVGLPLDKFSSIYANINNWFIERNGLLSYMYPQLTAVIKKRYLSSPEFVTSLHAALPDYFQNKYRGSDRCVEAVWHCQYINDTERLLQQCADLDLMPFLFAESFRKEYIACCRKAGGYEAVMTQCLANLHAVAEAGKDREGDAEYRAEMWHRKHLVAQFGREGGLYQQAAPLLIDLSSNIPPGITTAEAVEVLLLLQELHWRYKVEPQGGESKAGAAVRLLKQALGMLQEAEDKNLLSQVYHGLTLTLTLTCSRRCTMG